MVNQPLTDEPFSLDFEYDFRSGYRNVNHQHNSPFQNYVTRKITLHELHNLFAPTCYGVLFETFPYLYFKTIKIRMEKDNLLVLKCGLQAYVDAAGVG